MFIRAYTLHSACQRDLHNIAGLTLTGSPSLQISHPDARAVRITSEQIYGAYNPLTYLLNRDRQSLYALQIVSIDPGPEARSSKLKA